MNHITGQDRSQSTLFPELLDDYIDADNPIRFIDRFVHGLDLVDLDFRHALPGPTGRPPYDPADLLKLYIYGYTNAIRSSRKLEQAIKINVELMWLLRRLQPDFKTISDFRKDNIASLKKVFVAFTLFCKERDLFSLEFVAIDGSKFSASNHNSRTYTKVGVQKQLKQIEEKIHSYTKELDQNDRHERALLEPNEDTVRKQIANLQSKKAQLEQIQEQLEHSPDGQISLTDPDSRKMRTGNHGTDVCFNAQMSVDRKHKLIVDIDVTNDTNDQNQLYRMAKRTKEIFGVSELDVVIDNGYCKFEEIKRCEIENIHCFIPEGAKSQNRKLGLYTDKDFYYDTATDRYHCPAGNELTYRSTFLKGNKETRQYGTPACKSCPVASLCTRNKKGRILYRWVDQATIDQVNLQSSRNPDKVEQRKELVEHPFGTMKHTMNGRYFLLRTLIKVGAEISLLALAYNIKRVMNILGVKDLLRTLKKAVQPSQVIIAHFVCMLVLTLTASSGYREQQYY